VVAFGMAFWGMAFWGTFFRTGQSHATIVTPLRLWPRQGPPDLPGFFESVGRSPVREISAFPDPQGLWEPFAPPDPTGNRELFALPRPMVPL